MADTENGLKIRGGLKHTQSEVDIRSNVTRLGWTTLACKAFLNVSAHEWQKLSAHIGYCNNTALQHIPFLGDNNVECVLKIISWITSFFANTFLRVNRC